MYSKEDIIYLAGLFDGDGHVGVRMQNINAPWRCGSYLEVTNNSLDVMEWLDERFFGRTREEKGRAYGFIFNDDIELMKALYPHLIIKKEDMEHAIAMRVRGDDKSPMTTEEKIDRMEHAAMIYECHQARRRSGSSRGTKRYERLLEAIMELEQCM